MRNALKYATQAWEQGRISALDFLMVSNILSGRSADDISQYPIFPWIFSDYSAPTISTTPTSTQFRDLCKPMGAQSPQRASYVKERYESLLSTDTPPFHWGSLYSNPGIVVNWLLRIEPFASALVHLQSGYFDNPDRLTHSISGAWRTSALGGPSDVKELVPEVFCFPEFSRNSGLFLGKRHDSELVDDLVLPPWSSNPNPNLSPLRFCNIHRKALELSTNLTSWIDLIFGKHQQGEGAVERLNCFYYLAYSSSIEEVHKLTDPHARSAARHQVHCFGSIPRCLWPGGFHHLHLKLVPRNLCPWYVGKFLKFLQISELSSPLSSLGKEGEKFNIDLFGDSPTLIKGSAFATRKFYWSWSNFGGFGQVALIPRQNSSLSLSQSSSHPKILTLPSRITSCTADELFLGVGTESGQSFLLTSNDFTPTILTTYSTLHKSSIISMSIHHRDNLLATLDTRGCFAVWELSDGVVLTNGNLKGAKFVEFVLVEGSISLALVSRHAITIVSPFKGLNEVRITTPQDSVLASISCCTRPLRRLSRLSKLGSSNGCVVLLTGHLDGFVRFWTADSDGKIRLLAKFTTFDVTKPVVSIFADVNSVIACSSAHVNSWTIPSNEFKRSLVEEVKNVSCSVCDKKFGLISNFSTSKCEYCQENVCSSCLDFFELIWRGSPEGKEGKYKLKICFKCAYDLYSKLLSF
ncbi:hypothetical protein P9112_007020 [Eukaryota sp. TZLM1-RC]